MTSQHRKRRGRASETAVAWFLRPWFPYARAANSGAPGVDVDETPGLAIEIKARAKLDLPAWLRQAKRNAGAQQPLLIIRLNGQGTDHVEDWPVVLTLGDFMRLWEDRLPEHGSVDRVGRMNETIRQQLQEGNYGDQRTTGEL